MSKTLLIVIGILCAVIILWPLLFYGITGFRPDYTSNEYVSFSDLYNKVHLLSILATLAIVILLVMIIDTLITKRKGSLKSKIQEVRDEIKAGTRIAKDNQHSLPIRFVRWVGFTSLPFIIVGLVFAFIGIIFLIQFNLKIVFAMTAGLLLLRAIIRTLSAKTILIILGIACAVLTAVGVMWSLSKN